MFGGGATVRVVAVVWYTVADGSISIDRSVLHLHFLYLLDEIRLLVVELLVLCPIIVEGGEELDELLPIPQQNVGDRPRLVRISDEHLKDVEGLELDALALLLEEVHHQLEVVRVRDVPSHDVEVVAVEQQLAQQLQTLPPRHVVLAVEQLLVVDEEGVVVRVEELGRHRLVLRNQYLKCREGVAGDVEAAHLDVLEELVERLVVQDQLGEVVVSDALAQHRAARHSNVGALVPLDELLQHLGSRAQVLHGRRPRPDLPTQQVVEDECHVLFALKIKFGEVLDEHGQHVGRVRLLRELSHLLRVRLLSLLPVDDALDRLQPFAHLLDGLVRLLVALLDLDEGVLEVLDDVRRRLVRFTEDRQRHRGD
ncbi:hypothetical protein PFISCL1PPCAC_23102, partial [Pristionchus fissidentatus]